MNTKTVAADQMKALKSKLNAAIESRASLEEDFTAQSSMLIQFINKLSHVSKGLNLELDNRLAQLRALLSKSAPISEIENKIAEISKLLQRHAITNEQSITKAHQQFKEAGKSLQKINGLSDDLRRKLRSLLNESQSTKDNLAQYIPLFSQLLEFYDFSLKSKSDIPKGGLLGAQQKNTPEAGAGTNKDENTQVNALLIEKITACLSKLQLSTQHTKELLALNKKLVNDKSSDDVLQHFIEIFDVIVADLRDERDSAKTFLTTLSDTLTTVQSAVKKTLVTCQKSQVANDKINSKLQSQLLDMTSTVKKAMSLEQVRIDINSKLQNIASTLEQKSSLEQQGQQSLASQLDEMASKVKKLEVQSRAFEDKLAEQQRKSMQDALTKLSNRAAFDDYFTKAMVRFHHQPYELALVVMDIDNFKKINDTYGHTAGDKTLQVIANTIQKKVSDNAFVARYGGEEFVLIYANINKAALVKELNTLNKHIARLPFKFKSNKVSITLSMGVTHIKNDDNIHIAFERADEAMYQAKAQGKNQVIYQQ
ncbi:MAG: GGDEF domain-containing protein [Colwellia sp.]|nr:GGDEF domain-containing protein [Colwellia sp.]MCW8866198.1 GGDEF domain-containing protein [Colwellia sp.]MCW9082042.1 GGDEF domain-containing protein [Colwellia sp.]